MIYCGLPNVQFDAPSITIFSSKNLNKIPHAYNRDDVDAQKYHFFIQLPEVFEKIKEEGKNDTFISTIFCGTYAHR